MSTQSSQRRPAVALGTPRRHQAGLAWLAARPRAMAILGALTIAFSAILVKLAAETPSTAAIFRCAYALPVLGALALRENRRARTAPSPRAGSCSASRPGSPTRPSS